MPKRTVSQGQNNNQKRVCNQQHPRSKGKKENKKPSTPDDLKIDNIAESDEESSEQNSEECLLEEEQAVSESLTEEAVLEYLEDLGADGYGTKKHRIHEIRNAVLFQRVVSNFRRGGRWHGN
jgi:hypothetical protein